METFTLSQPIQHGDYTMLLYRVVAFFTPSREPQQQS